MKKLLITIILLSACIAQAQTDEKETLKQLSQNAISAYQNQKFDDAIKFGQQAVDLSLKIYGADQPETANAYKNLGAIYQDSGKIKESVESLQMAVEIYQKLSNSDNKDSIASYQMLAYSQFLGGKKKEAETNYLKAIGAIEKKYGTESKESFNTILNTANFYARIGNKDQAGEFYLKSYRLAKKYFGEESKEFEAVDLNIRFYFKDGRIEKEFKEKFASIVGYESAKATSLIIPMNPSPMGTRRKIGMVIVKVRIDEAGSVQEAKMISGDVFFQSVAESAALKSKFKSATKNGNPVSAVDYITFNFQ